MTLQLPEPTQVVKARTGSTVYVLFQTKFTVEQYPKVTDNIGWLNGISGLVPDAKETSRMMVLRGDR